MTGKADQGAAIEELQKKGCVHLWYIGGYYGVEFVYTSLGLREPEAGNLGSGAQNWPWTYIRIR